MKTASIPSVPVEPEFLAEVESVLAEGESLSEFFEASVSASVERRCVPAEFVARGLRSRDEAKRTAAREIVPRGALLWSCKLASSSRKSASSARARSA